MFLVWGLFIDSVFSCIPDIIAEDISTNRTKCYNQSNSVVMKTKDLGSNYLTSLVA